MANSNDNGRITQIAKIFKMKTSKNLYQKIYSINNLIFAWKKARKGKTKKDYVIEFEKDLAYNLIALHYELKYQIYEPKPLQTFILRDPKIRKISKSDFRDRIVHHALCNILEPIFDKTFIYDNCASRKYKGTLFALKRFEKFRRKLTFNFTSECYCLKADIKHYFEEINHEILLEIIKKKIKCEETLWLLKRVIERERERREDLSLIKGMPLGNLTSQFFANIYLNELDYFVKHKLRVKYYIRYVDDFIILHNFKEQLEKWKCEINKFLKEKLKLELHKDKSKIINLSKGIDFVGFRNFYYFKLLRKRNIRNIERKINLFNKREISYEKLFEIFQGWNAYANWGNSENIVNRLIKEIIPFE